MIEYTKPDWILTIIVTEEKSGNSIFSICFILAYFSRKENMELIWNSKIVFESNLSCPSFTPFEF
jgi:hypothetical protein